MSRTRGFVFTTNNPTEEVYQTIANQADDSVYLIIGSEVGDENTPHLQGCIYYADGKTFKAAAKLIPKSRIKPMRGTCKEASDYCKKEGDFVEFGTCPMTQRDKGEAEKVRWTEMKLAIKEGRFTDLPDQYQVQWAEKLKFKRAALNSFDRPDPKRLETLENYWYHGPTRTGKTFKAMEWAEQKGLTWWRKSRNKWWDGYQGQDVVIIDEVGDECSVMPQYFKEWADRYVITAETKGGTMEIRPKHIIVTSNYPMEQIFTNPNDLPALRKRYTEVDFADLKVWE